MSTSKFFSNFYTDSQDGPVSDASLMKSDYGCE